MENAIVLVRFLDYDLAFLRRVAANFDLSIPGDGKLVDDDDLVRNGVLIDYFVSVLPFECSGFIDKPGKAVSL